MCYKARLCALCTCLVPDDLRGSEVFMVGSLGRGPQGQWKGWKQETASLSFCPPQPSVPPPPPLTGTRRPKSAPRSKKLIVLPGRSGSGTVEGLAGDGTAPCPLAWAGGSYLEGWTEARTVPPPLRGGEERLGPRLPARADKGPSWGSHKRFITVGGTARRAQEGA